MKFLADQDVYAVTIGFLKRLGHEVVTASQLGHSRTPDSQLLNIAHEEGRIFITRDRDFGGLVFVQGQSGGVVYLRIMPSTLDAVHSELARVLALYSQGELGGSFVVIEPVRHRIRRASTAPRR